MKKLLEYFRWLQPECLGDLTELDHFWTPLASLHLRHEALRLAQKPRELNLGDTRRRSR